MSYHIRAVHQPYHLQMQHWITLSYMALLYDTPEHRRRNLSVHWAAQYQKLGSPLILSPHPHLQGRGGGILSPLSTGKGVGGILSPHPHLQGRGGDILTTPTPAGKGRGDIITTPTGKGVGGILSPHPHLQGRGGDILTTPTPAGKGWGYFHHTHTCREGEGGYYHHTHREGGGGILAPHPHLQGRDRLEAEVKSKSS